ARIQRKRGTYAGDRHAGNIDAGKGLDVLRGVEIFTAIGASIDAPIAQQPDRTSAHLVSPALEGRREVWRQENAVKVRMNVVSLVQRMPVGSGDGIERPDIHFGAMRTNEQNVSVSRLSGRNEDVAAVLISQVGRYYRFPSRSMRVDELGVIAAPQLCVVADEKHFERRARRN